MAMQENVQIILPACESNRYLKKTAAKLNGKLLIQMSIKPRRRTAGVCTDSFTGGLANSSHGHPASGERLAGHH